MALKPKSTVRIEDIQTEEVVSSSAPNTIVFVNSITSNKESIVIPTLSTKEILPTIPITKQDLVTTITTAPIPIPVIVDDIAISSSIVESEVVLNNFIVEQSNVREEKNKELIDDNATLISDLLQQIALLSQSKYEDELRVIRNLNDSLVLLQGTLYSINKLDKQLNLNSNLQLLLQDINSYIVDKTLSIVDQKFTKLFDKIDTQNYIENSKFQILDTTLSTINLDNISVLLISNSGIQKIEISTETLDNKNITISINPEDLTSINDKNYLLFFTNSLYLYNNITFNYYNYNDVFDIIAFKDVTEQKLIGNKVILKQDDKPITESLIYNQEQVNEYSVLIIDKINSSFNQVDIVQNEIEEFYLPIQVLNTDVDDIQNLLIGKRIYDKSQGTFTYFNEDEETIYKIVRTYLDPTNSLETRIPTDV